MSTINGLNQFLVPAQDGFLYQLFYNTVYGGNTGCTININGTDVQMGPKSSINILVRSVSGGTGCFLGGDRPYIYGDSQQYKYVPQTFVSVWDTARTSAGSSTATRVALPLISTGTYNFIVDWGDGSTDRITSWNQAETTHTYATAGVYQIIITGTIQGFRFANTGDRLKILSIFRWGTPFRLGATDSHFQGCANLDLSQVEDVFDLTSTTTLANSFRGCTRLTTVNRMNEWNVSNITSLDSTFMDSPNFNTYIGDWDTSNVNTMTNCFNMATANGLVGNFNQDISKWNTSKVTTMASMFFNSLNFNQDISTKVVTRTNGTTYIAWDTSNVNTMSFMLAGNFVGRVGIFNQNIGNWNTSKVTTMVAMFQTQKEFNQDISTKVVTVSGASYIAWDTSNVNTMVQMFNAGTGGNTGKFNQNIGNWNTSKVTTLGTMFQNQLDFNQDISTKVVTVSGASYIAWDTSNVNSVSFMFTTSAGYTGKFNQNIGNWNTSKVTTISAMFQNQIDFNQDLSTKVVTISGASYIAWDTSNVTNMSFFLGGGTISGKFNGNVNNWNTSKVTTMQSMFFNKNDFNQDISTKVVTVSGSPYVAWDVSNVINIQSMFSVNTYDGKFNQNIGNWNTNKVTTTQFSFNGQRNFNQDIGTKQVTVSASTYSAWTVSAVTNMIGMFYISNPATTGQLAGSFNNSGSTSINNWDMRRVTGATDMFNYQTGFNQPINNWNISGVTTFSSTGSTIGTDGFMFGKTFNDYSAENYDALLIGWSSRTVRPSQLLNMGSIKYTAAATAARTILTSAPNNWTIVDGGLVLPFTSIWRTTASNETVTLPYLASGANYTGVIDWGDGFTSGNTYANRTHTYATAGDYTISINGMISGFCFNNTGDRLKLREITRWGTEFRPNNSSGTFYGCTNLVLTGVSDTLNLAGMTSLAYFFADCTSLTTIARVNEWDTSNITTMAAAFSQARNFNDNIGGWNTSNVTSMNSMFFITSFAGKFNNGGSSDIGNWDTSKVTDMTYMFYNQQTFNQPIGTKAVTVGSTTYTAWDVKNVTDFTFFLNITTAVGGNGNFNQDISTWNTSKLTSLFVTFSNQPLFNQDLSTKVVTVNGVTYTAWDTSNVTNMDFAFIIGGTFTGGNFNGNISNWNTSKVTTMASILSNQPKFNQDISTKVVSVSGVSYTAWDTSNVTNMSFMFWVRNAESGIFNQNISNWNTSKVTNMGSMFINQPLFNQDIGTKAVTVSGVTYSAWSVSAVTSMNQMFSGNTAGSFNNSGSTSINNWDVRKVTNMNSMFNNQTGFTQPINNWIVSGVTNFGTTGLTAGFMAGKTDTDYSAENYDNLLIGWSSRTVQPNLVLNMGTIKRTEASTAAKTILTSAPNNWTIVDGGLVLPFTSIWRTTASNETVTLPYLASGAKYTGVIDWGDGFTSGNTYANRTHTYATAGDYTISINGAISGFCFNNTGDKLKLREITRWGTEFKPNNNYGTFFGCSNLVLTGVTDTLNLVGMSALTTFFYACTSLTTVNRINEWNTSNIVSLNRMFETSTNFNDNIGGWDTSNVVDMQNIFASAISFNNGGSPDINNWNTSKVTTMRFLFGTGTSGGAHKFNQPIGDWNTSAVTDMSSMFQKNNKFNQDIYTKSVTKNGVTYTAWDVKNVTSMSFMFYVYGGFTGEFNGNISTWNIGKLTSLYALFGNQRYLNQDISTKSVTINGVTYTAWDTSLITNMGYTFYLGTGSYGNFNQDISNWNTANVTSMTGLFERQTSFNQPLNSWNTAKVTNMGDMFNLATSFNQPIGNWVVSGVTTFVDDAIEGFMGGKTFNDYSTTNYDALLIGWASRPVLANKTINFGTIKYTSAAVAARAILTSAPNNWTIVDGGLT